MQIYKIYQIPNNEPMKAICNINVEDKTTYDELEMQVDILLKHEYKELVFICVELVLVNTETNNADYRFNYVEDNDEDFNIQSEDLIPFLDILESDFLYYFVQSYEDTYKKKFKGNKNRLR